MRPPSHRGSTTTTMRDSSESSQCLPRLLMLLRQSFGSAPAAERQTRHFKLANCDDTAPVDLESGKPFPANSISTAKYSLLTFIPRALFEQFRRLANVYFLIITVLMMFGTYTPLFDSPLTPYTTLIPLSIVLAISLSKEGFEDLRRHKADRRTNTQMIRVLALERSGQIQTVECKHVQVGRILKVVEGDEIPADLLFLVSSQDDSTCSVETANIDGETNLKTKRAVSIGINGSAFRAAEELHGLRAQVECEASNPRIHSFTGTIHLQGRSVPVDQTNLLLRGSQLRHTEWVLGIVVFTGYHTKIMQNSRQAPSKLSKIEETTNRLLYLVLGTQIVLATVSFLAYLMWSHANEVKLPYLCYQHAKGNHFYSENCQYANITSDLGMFLTFFVLYNNFVPISLYVTVEMVNYSQAYMIDHDPAMYDSMSDTPAMARTSNMNGDLGCVHYAFTDKTGTLTTNEMIFKRCSVGDQIYGNLDVGDREVMGAPQDPREEGLEISELSDKSRTEALAEYRFNEVLAVCHTVTTVYRQGETRFQAESPDEIALVGGAAQMRWHFQGRAANRINVQAHGQDLTYTLLAVLPFTSTRKRMSVIVRTPADTIVIMLKGADSVVLERSVDCMDTTRDRLVQHLSVFASEGLRTLLLARREVGRREFATWHAKFQQSSIAIDDREERMAAVAEEIERDLTLIGAVAVEDRLQEGVPSTIAHLLQAGVKVWVLTGDKVETAINIGYSTRLLDSSLTLIKVVDTEGEVSKLHEQLQRLHRRVTRLAGLTSSASCDTMHAESDFYRSVVFLILLPRYLTDQSRPVNIAGSSMMHDQTNHYKHRWQVAGVSDSLADEPTSVLSEPLLDPQEDAAMDGEPLKSDNLAMVIDGPALALIFGHGEREKLLLDLATLCKAVMACRVSPAQKRLLVRLVKKGLQPPPVTLAVGDGANDVAMIQEAQIGIGVSGKEGRQAVNSSDFAIAQFRFLEPLMLKHGRWDYRRISKVILYSFYKNIVLTMMLFYFTWSTGFSGQSLFEDFVYSGYNFFLAMPIICVGIFDRDVSPETTSKYQWMYMSGRENRDLNLQTMAQWLLAALLDSIIIFFLAHEATNRPRSVLAWRGYGDDLYIVGLLIYSCMLMAMFHKVATITYTWTWINWFFYVGSILLYLVFLLTYSLLPRSVDSFYWIPYQMFSRPFFWLCLLLLPTINLVITYALSFLRLSLRPSPVDIAIEHDRSVHA